MKYTARDESRVANKARGEVKCYVCHKTLIKSCILPNHSSITTNFNQYGSHRSVEVFDQPTQNTIKTKIEYIFKVSAIF